MHSREDTGKRNTCFCNQTESETGCVLVAILDRMSSEAGSFLLLKTGIPMTYPLPSKSLCTVVVADDDPAWRLLVRLLLEPRGYHVVEANDGVDALGAVRAVAPQVLVLDLMMPRLGGLEVCQRLCANSAGRPRVILMTAADDVAELQPGKANGVDLLLTKPFDPAKLLRAIESLVTSCDQALAVAGPLAASVGATSISATSTTTGIAGSSVAIIGSGASTAEPGFAAAV